jgi:hypothetical protein
MAGWILGSNGDGVFGSNNGDLGENGITNSTLNRLDLLDSFLVGETIEEQIDIRSRAELLMVVFSQLALGGVIFLGDGEKAVDDRGTSSHDIFPVHIGKRRLGEDVEVALEFLRGLDNGWGTMSSTVDIFERHDVAVFLLLSFCLEVSGTSGNKLGILGE